MADLRRRDAGEDERDDRDRDEREAPPAPDEHRAERSPAASSARKLDWENDGSSPAHVIAIVSVAATAQSGSPRRRRITTTLARIATTRKRP